MPSRGTSKPRLPFRGRLFQKAGDLLIEFVGTVLTIGSIALADYLLKSWIGDGKKFFDILPIQWVFDFCHLCVIGRFLWRFLSGKEGSS